jgi:hypothetical protein
MSTYERDHVTAVLRQQARDKFEELDRVVSQVGAGLDWPERVELTAAANELRRLLHGDVPPEALTPARQRPAAAHRGRHGVQAPDPSLLFVDRGAARPGGRMKIIALQSENVKRLKAVHIKPDGSMVVIRGDNGAGKSSVLDSIMYALGGTALCAPQVIRNGQEHAEVTIDLGESRRHRGGGPRAARRSA